MKSAPVQWTDVDRRIWEEELDEFVPARVFDVHTHIYRWAFNTDPHTSEGPMYVFAGTTFAEADWDMLAACDRVLFPGREVHRLSFPFPFAPAVDFAASNEFVARQTKADPLSAALMLVHPAMSADDVEAQIDRHEFLGFKPYRVYATSGDTVNCQFTEFMPEHLIEVADRRRLLIMMHLAKRDAIADADNLNDLERLSQRYPNARWILAHCARGYSAWAIEKAARRLRGLHNVWFDTSSVCESDAFDALYSHVGIERVMYGSDDLPVGVLRGKYIAFGYAWAYLSPSNQSLALSHCDGHMTFTRYEQLRAMKRASQRLGINSRQHEALFFDTAHDLVQSVRCRAKT
jgi:predicted TIM-barrel fold metal-dependent hydrolase